MAEVLHVPEIPAARLPPENWGAEILCQVGTAVDGALIRAMQWVVDSALLPAEEDLPALRESLTLALDPALQRDPGRFFRFGDAPVPRSQTEQTKRRLRGGFSISRTFETDYRPYDSGQVDPQAASPVLVEHWMHPGRPRATVVALHGFTMGYPRMDSVALFAGQWFRRGLDVALMTLPHHGKRTPPGARFSGQHFAVPQAAVLGEAVRQAVYETRLLTKWLRESTGAPVGLLGLSLGGYVASLTAGLTDELDFVVPMVPPVCIGDMAWQFYQRSRKMSRSKTPIFTHQELRAAFRVHSPLAHELMLPRERVFIVAGRGDRVVPPEHPSALWEHWGRPGIHWFNGSHLAPFGRSRIVAAIDGHLRRLHIL